MSIADHPEAAAATVAGSHFSCSLTAILLARVHEQGGDDAVAEVLLRAETSRTREYLMDIGNWISFDEGQALWRAGAEVTHHPQFARAVGEDAVRRLSGSPVAALLRRADAAMFEDKRAHHAERRALRAGQTAA